MGCSCHATKRVTTARQVVNNNRMVTNSILFNKGNNGRAVKKVIRRSISH